MLRTYRVHVPAGPAPAAWPLILAFHGGGSNAAEFQARIGLDALADRERFVTVYPDGTGVAGVYTWNAELCCGYPQIKQIDDVGFARALVDRVAVDVPIDRDRVYAIGFSNGGMLAYRLAAQAGDLVAAIASVGGAVLARMPEGARPMPVLHLHDVTDTRAPYDGGFGPWWPYFHRVLHAPVSQAVRAWVDRDGCPRPPATVDTRTDGARRATHVVWTPCRDGTEVALWEVEGSGHYWFGAPRGWWDVVAGRAPALVDANQEIWTFLRRFTRRGGPVVP